MVASDQAQPSKLPMPEPTAMAPCLYVPESESCAREPSMTATDQAQPSKLPMPEPTTMAPSPSVPGREPSAREPSMVAPNQTKSSKLTFFGSLLVNTIFFSLYLCIRVIRRLLEYLNI